MGPIMTTLFAIAAPFIALLWPLFCILFFVFCVYNGVQQAKK